MHLGSTSCKLESNFHYLHEKRDTCMCGDRYETLLSALISQASALTLILHTKLGICFHFSSTCTYISTQYSVCNHVGIVCCCLFTHNHGSVDMYTHTGYSRTELDCAHVHGFICILYSYIVKMHETLMFASKGLT